MVRIPDGHYRSLLVEDLMENQTYTYRVRALNKWGCGEFRVADMKIENMGSRPPSGENKKYLVLHKFLLNFLQQYF